MGQQRPGELNLELANLNKYPAKPGTGIAKTSQRPKKVQNCQREAQRRPTEAQRRPAEVRRPPTEALHSPQRLARMRAVRRKRFLRNVGCAVIAVNVFIVLLYFFFFQTGEEAQGVLGKGAERIPKESSTEQHPEWTEDLLTVNEYSRPGTPIGEVKNIFVHYTANPGTSAAQNRSYFEQLKDTRERSASAHFIIGYEGEIILCVPLEEVAYAVIGRNEDSLSIECCYLEEDGSFTEATYNSLIKLLGWLIKNYGLEAEDILRHYDCGGKKCPLYYTENEDKWEKLKEDVEKNGL